MKIIQKMPLYRIGYGPGQTEWQDRVRKWDEELRMKYLQEREETLRREENTPSKFEMAVKQNEEMLEEIFGKKNTSNLQLTRSELVLPDLSAV